MTIDQRAAVRYWEVRRILFLLLVAPAAQFGWGMAISLNSELDGFPVPNVSDPYVYVQFAVAAVLANVGYSLGYVLEFFTAASIDARPSRKRLRSALFVALCLCGVYAAFGIGGRIAHTAALQMYAFPQSYEKATEAKNP